MHCVYVSLFTWYMLTHCIYYTATGVSVLVHRLSTTYYTKINTPLTVTNHMHGEY